MYMLVFNGMKIRNMFCRKFKLNLAILSPLARIC